MPIQNSFGALRRTNRSNVDPNIGGTGWISKLDTRQGVGAIVTPTISDIDGTNTVISLIPQYTYLGNTYPSTMLVANNTGVLNVQLDAGIATPQSGSLFRITTDVMMIGRNSAGQAQITRMNPSNPLVDLLTFPTILAYHTGIVCSGDVSVSRPPFYTITSPSQGNSGTATITKFSQTFDTVTETWKKSINALTSGLYFKKIYSRVESATSEIYIAGDLESTTGGSRKLYIAKLSSTGTFLWQNVIGWNFGQLEVKGLTEGYILCNDGIFISYDFFTGALGQAAYLSGFDTYLNAGITKTLSGEISSISRGGMYIPNLISAFNFGRVDARQITNVTDPDTVWTAIGQIGTNTLTTNTGVVLGGAGITASSDVYAITMQVPYAGQIPYTGTYVLDGKTFTYTAVNTITATNAIGDLTQTTPSFTFTTTTTARTQSGGGGEPTTYTYNKINIGV